MPVVIKKTPFQEKLERCGGSTNNTYEAASRIAKNAELPMKFDKKKKLSLSDRFEALRLGYEMKLVENSQTETDVKVAIYQDADTMDQRHFVKHSPFNEYGVHKTVSPSNRRVVRGRAPVAVSPQDDRNSPYRNNFGEKASPNHNYEKNGSIYHGAMENGRNNNYSKHSYASSPNRYDDRRQVRNVFGGYEAPSVV